MTTANQRDALTSPARACIDGIKADMGLFLFIIDLVSQTDYGTHMLDCALARKKRLTREEFELADPGEATQFLSKNHQALFEMFLTRLTDVFQKYLVDLIRVVLRKEPAILSTRKESITVEEIMRFKTIDDFVQVVIERKVAGLTYEGFGRIREWCCDKGIPIEVTPEQLPIVVELVACRNIIAHNRGSVDERYLDAVPGSKFKLGEKRTLVLDEIASAAVMLLKIIQNSDAAAITKFGLAAEVPPEAIQEDPNRASANCENVTIEPTRGVVSN